MDGRSASGFKLTWEAFTRKYYINCAEKVYIQLHHKYCISVDIGRIIEDERDLVDIR
jgi:hypothetical protein